MPVNAQKDFKISIPPIDLSNSEHLRSKRKNNSYIDQIHIPIKNHENFSQEEKPFFIIPLRLDKRPNENELSHGEKKRRPYLPQTEVAKRTDTGFYQAFYAPEILGIFADYDDVIAQFTTRNPDAKFTFDAATGKVAIEDGLAYPREINDFIQQALQFEVPASAFDPEGSIRRVEERQWFQALKGIDLNSRATTLYELQSASLLQRAVPGITQQEINSNRLIDTNKQAMRKFYRRRQLFWHPDRWNHSNGLTVVQKKEITEMSTRLNRLGSFT